MADRRAVGSVFIPGRDGGGDLDAAAPSVLAQLHAHVDLIVVDDGSRDGTPDLLRALEPSLRWVRQETSGISAALNRGVGLARGRYLAFLDADDLWAPAKLELQLSRLEE